jgi:hypothetical protein
MVNSEKTPEEQIALLEAEAKSEAEGLSHDDLLGKLNDVIDKPSDLASRKAAEDKATALLKSIQVVRGQFLKSSGEEKHLKPLSNLLRKHAFIIEFSKNFSSTVNTSKNWKRQAQQNQEEKCQTDEEALAQGRAVDFQSAPQHNQNAHSIYNALSAARGAARGGGSGSRGKSLVSQVTATAPNPSTINNTNPSYGRTRVRSAAVEVAKGMLPPTLNISGEHRDYLDGTGHKSSMGTCSACDQRMLLEELEHKEVRQYYTLYIISYILLPIVVCSNKRTKKNPISRI